MPAERRRNPASTAPDLDNANGGSNRCLISVPGVREPEEGSPKGLPSFYKCIISYVKLPKLQT